MNTLQHPGLLLAGGVLALALGLVLQQQLAVHPDAGAGPTDAAPAPAARLLGSRELRFVPLADGREAVLDGGSGGLVYMLPADKNKDSFLRVTIRILKRNRALRGASPDAPFRLAVNSEEGLVLEDALSDSHLPIRAFGTSAVQSLSPLLTAVAVPIGALPPTCPRPEC